MKVHSKDGIEMMDVKSIDKQGDVLVVKGKMMGSMPATIHIGPDAIWESFKMLSWKTRFGLVGMLIKGALGGKKKG
ncbi:MAG: hypothetical protein CL814_10465 [Confluentimicrobium sp.]|jgi:hypothetical protein|nr:MULTISPECIES: hypothetical protein [Actibacterium]ALG91661.1 hypothetical protein TQ29_17535 [Actibacterium sp. EMB200-NS6]KGB83324.1 hypothetical protein JT55_03185 [Rhodovulum sp. NI22]MBC57347.1 hypothetical protein [Actibacterium sp.]|tara:strand:- start:15045 stop:15272 length:228 start_codon:yes stop_codon:yes gene_type:complete